MGLSWSIGLTDNVSGPASSAASAVSLLAKAMAKLAKATSGGSMASVNDVVSRVSDTIAKSAALKANGNDSAAAKAAAAQDRADARAQAQAEKAAGRELAAMAKRQLKAEEQAVKAAERQAQKVARAAEKAAEKGGGHAGAITRVQGAHPGKPSSGGALDFLIPSGVSDRAAQLEGMLSKLKGAMGSLAPEASAAASGIEATGAEAAAAGGPVTMIAAAYVAAAAAVATLVIAGAGLALQMSEVREKSVLAFDALSKGGHGGEVTLAMIGRLNKELPQSGGQLKTWAKELMAAGTTDMGVLEKRIKAIASAEALMGEDGAAAAAKVKAVFEKIAMAEQTGKKLKDAGKLLQDTGVTAAEVAAKLGMPVAKLNAALKTGSIDAKKFGDAMSAALIEKGKGPLEAMNHSLDTIRTKVMGAFMGMFSGVKTGPFLDQLRKIGDMLIKVMGGEGKAGVTAFFDAFFTVATSVLGLVAAALGWVIEKMHQIAPYAKIAGSALKSAFDAAGGVDTLTTAMKGLAVVAAVVGAVLALGFSPILIGIGLIVAVIGVIGAFVAALAFAVGAVIEWVASIGAAIDAAGGLVAAAQQLGSSIAQGVANGISNGVAWVEAAVASLGNAAIAAVRRVLDMHSPSRVMMALGAHTAEGFAQGVEDHPGPQAAMANAVAPPDAAGGGKAGAHGGRGGGTFSIGEIHVHGGGDAMATARSVRKEIEDLASEWGFSPVPA